MSKYIYRSTHSEVWGDNHRLQITVRLNFREDVNAAAAETAAETTAETAAETKAETKAETAAAAAAETVADKGLLHYFTPYFELYYKINSFFSEVKTRSITIANRDENDEGREYTEKKRYFVMSLDPFLQPVLPGKLIIEDMIDRAHRQMKQDSLLPDSDKHLARKPYLHHYAHLYHLLIAIGCDGLRIKIKKAVEDFDLKVTQELSKLRAGPEDEPGVGLTDEVEENIKRHLYYIADGVKTLIIKETQMERSLGKKASKPKETSKPKEIRASNISPFSPAAAAVARDQRKEEEEKSGRGEGFTSLADPKWRSRSSSAGSTPEETIFPMENDHSENEQVTSPPSQEYKGSSKNNESGAGAGAGGLQRPSFCGFTKPSCVTKSLFKRPLGAAFPCSREGLLGGNGEGARRNMPTPGSVPGVAGLFNENMANPGNNSGPSSNGSQSSGSQSSGSQSSGSQSSGSQSSGDGLIPFDFC